MSNDIWRDIKKSLRDDFGWTITDFYGNPSDIKNLSSADVYFKSPTRNILICARSKHFKIPSPPPTLYKNLEADWNYIGLPVFRWDYSFPWKIEVKKELKTIMIYNDAGVKFAFDAS
jgi:hypothetical protein